jgi:hypothetical protein
MKDTMTTSLTQALVAKLHEDHPQGAILYDATVPGLARKKWSAPTEEPGSRY